MENYTVPLPYFEKEINDGHQGHFYKTRIPSMYPYRVIVQLIGVDTGNNLVNLNVFDRWGEMEYTSVHEGDLYTISYLGPTPPKFRSGDIQPTYDQCNNGGQRHEGWYPPIWDECGYHSGGWWNKDGWSRCKIDENADEWLSLDKLQKDS
ncbi:hypothetical protein [Clostridium beijerinckii]|uniref:hypothetical protein n=1 Tax=Clostridium beijerinckii TaxID=1520 RepID=UPI001F24810F|nr:hypothetical protein [Clostridium beijerinckii]